MDGIASHASVYFVNSAQAEAVLAERAFPQKKGQASILFFYKAFKFVLDKEESLSQNFVIEELVIEEPVQIYEPCSITPLSFRAPFYLI